MKLQQKSQKLTFIWNGMKRWRTYFFNASILPKFKQCFGIKSRFYLWFIYISLCSLFLRVIFCCRKSKSEYDLSIIKLFAYISYETYVPHSFVRLDDNVYSQRPLHVNVERPHTHTQACTFNFFHLIFRKSINLIKNCLTNGLQRYLLSDLRVNLLFMELIFYLKKNQSTQYKKHRCDKLAGNQTPTTATKNSILFYLNILVRSLYKKSKNWNFIK